jgi:MFS family permease
LFINYEKKHKEPLIDLSIFKNVPFTIGNITGILSFIIMYAVLFLTPYYLDQVKHLSIFQASLIITAIPIGMTISTPISGIMSDNRGPAIPSIIGLGMATTGALLLSIINITGTYIITCTGLILIGSGIGMFTPPNNTHIMGNVSKKVLGIAGGILNMSRTLGMSLGITLGGLSYQFFQVLYGRSGTDILVHIFRSAYFLVAIVSFITFIITFRNYKNEFKDMGGIHSKQVGIR